jgi:peptide/nickel transport system substrate-binding protein
VKRKIFYYWFATILLLCLLLPACAKTTPTTAPSSTSTTPPKTALTSTAASPTPSTPSPRYGGILKVGMSQDAKAFYDPTRNLSLWEMIMAAPVLESLAQYDEAGNIQPRLAESWQTDIVAKTFTIKLKKGINFHDGTPFNAEAVKWNLDLYITSKHQWLANVKSVDVIDDYTVRANLNIGDLGTQYCVLLNDVYMASPTAWNNQGKDWAMTHPIGTGPFKFVSWVRDVSIKLEKFDGYWQKGKPYLDGIEFDIIVDPMTREAAFKSENIYLNRDITARQAQTYKSDAKYVVNVQDIGGDYLMLAPSGGNPESPLADVRLRKAVSYAINTQEIVDNLFFGFAGVTTQWGAPGGWAYNPDVKGYPYDPAKAQQLMAEAGFSTGFKTKLIFIGGRGYEDMMTAIQDMLAKVNIKAELIPVQSPNWREYTKPGWDGILHMASPTHGDAVSRLRMYLVREPVRPSILIVDEYGKLLDEAQAASDMNVRQAIVWELQKAVYDDQVTFIPAWVAKTFSVRYPYVHNDGFDKIVGNWSWSPEECWLEK